MLNAMLNVTPTRTSVPATIFKAASCLLAAACLAFCLSSVARANDDGSVVAGGASLAAGSSASELTAQAVTWRSIKTPEQLRALTLREKGFGPGNYRIDADFTLGDSNNTDEDVATCALLSGNFVIDFNGHTVQSACENLATFTVQGANVTFMDSKASTSKVSVNGLGIACIEVRSGSATVESGTYWGHMFSNAGSTALAVVGGTLSVRNCVAQGNQAALMNGGGTLNVYGGTFNGGYPYAYLHMGGTTKIVRGTFNAGKDYYGATFAIGALSLGNPVDLNALLPSGSSWGAGFQTAYYSGTGKLYAAPAQLYPYAVLYGTQQASVTVLGPTTIKASNVAKTFGNADFFLNAKSNGDGALTYSSSNAKVAAVNAKTGKVHIKGVGSAKITVKAAATKTSKAARKIVTLKVAKAKNPAKVSAATKSAKAASLKRKAVKVSGAVKVKSAKGKVTYRKKSGSSKLGIAKKTGKITVKRGTKAGKYSMKVTVKAAGNANYKQLTKTVTVRIIVK